MITKLRQGRVWKIRRQDLFNIYLLLGGLSIVVATTVFTYRMAKSVEKQSFLATQLISGVASLLLENKPLEEVRPVVTMINTIEVPIIISDNKGRPLLWNEPVIGIPLPDYQVLFQENMSKPSSPVIIEILSLAAAYDQDQEPFAIFNQDGRRVGTLHYGRSALSQRLRIMPYLELMVMALFFLVILYALQSKKDAQQKALFAGMAKETAHQLGTPLTSIMGWLALLEERLEKNDEVVLELNRDVDRLSMISARFSQIGSLPKLNDTDLVGVVDETINYFQKRLPNLGGRVQLRREGDSSNSVIFNRDLLGWVLENLIKTGIDALIEGKGTITVALEDLSDGGVALRVSDTGKGIPAREGNKIFEPGFTTKKRGWGMGLALVKRIATQYHNGKIRIESTSQHGTTFLVTLPPAPGGPAS
jgi:two-component system, sporulation sensor kinase D